MNKKEAIKHDLFCLARWSDRYYERAQAVTDEMCHSYSFKEPVKEEYIDTAMQLKRDIKQLKSFVEMLLIDAGLTDEYRDQCTKWLIEEEKWGKFRADCDKEIDDLLKEGI